MNAIDIKLLSPSDWKIFKQIHLEALKKYPQAFGAKYSDWVNYSDEKWKERPNDKNTKILVAMSGSIPIGLLGIHYEENQETLVAHIWGMYVNEKFRRSGIGRSLFENALKQIEKDEVHSVKLMVESDPNPALELYKSFGFSIIDSVDYTLGDGKEHKLYKMQLETK